MSNNIAANVGTSRIDLSVTANHINRAMLEAAKAGTLCNVGLAYIANGLLGTPKLDLQQVAFYSLLTSAAMGSSAHVLRSMNNDIAPETLLKASLLTSVVVVGATSLWLNS
jgi:hypothetical protein